MVQKRGRPPRKVSCSRERTNAETVATKTVVTDMMTEEKEEYVEGAVEEVDES